MVYLEPSEGLPGNHVYATNGIWGFDHNGWTKESELLSTIEQAYSLKYPGWDYSKLTIEPGPDALEKFCKDHNHRLPWQYAYLPWERAYSYINKFDSTPPTDSAV
ncbi:MAG: hypothetical protein JWN38_170 [Candidatus Saccharibacteria bacterium]|nr:hypothetical protein [Candidatus Saccharibacteria bacterium]